MRYLEWQWENYMDSGCVAEKKPAGARKYTKLLDAFHARNFSVVETEFGDLIAVRHLMFLSLSYDHRVVDGFLGGSFLRKVGDYLESFPKDRGI